jgi:hypothetical protein
MTTGFIIVVLVLTVNVFLILILARKVRKLSSELSDTSIRNYSRYIHIEELLNIISNSIIKRVENIESKIGTGEGIASIKESFRRIEDLKKECLLVQNRLEQEIRMLKEL